MNLRSRSWLVVGAVLAVAALATWRSVRAPQGHSAEQSQTPEAGAPGAGTPQGGAPSSQAQPPDAHGDPVIHRLERRIMGTVWAIMIAGGEPQPAREAIMQALDEVGRLERVLSEWLPDSEVSAVNRAAGRNAVHVGPDLMTCMKASLEIARWSDGAFDVSWAALRDLWDFGPDSTHTPPSQAQVKARLPLWNWHNIRVDEAQSTIFLTRAGMQIGLGGIAKGYAADRAGEILLRAGFNDFLVFAGGQVLVHGKRGNRAWRVGIQHPREPDYFGFVEVSQGSVATSGDYEHSFFYEGRRYHHIIDPKTGFPSDKTASVTLIAPTGLWADAADTAVFILGPERGLKALATAPGGPYEAVIVAPDLKLATTPAMRDRLLLRNRIDSEQRLADALPADAPAETMSGKKLAPPAAGL